MFSHSHILKLKKTCSDTSAVGELLHHFSLLMSQVVYIYTNPDNIDYNTRRCANGEEAWQQLEVFPIFLLQLKIQVCFILLISNWYTFYND